MLQQDLWESSGRAGESIKGHPKAFLSSRFLTFIRFIALRKLMRSTVKFGYLGRILIKPVVLDRNDSNETLIHCKVKLVEPFVCVQHSIAVHAHHDLQDNLQMWFACRQ